MAAGGRHFLSQVVPRRSGAPSALPPTSVNPSRSNGILRVVNTATVSVERIPGGAVGDEATESRDIRAARDGDAQAFERLYRRHGGWVYGLCWLNRRYVMKTTRLTNIPRTALLAAGLLTTSAMAATVDESRAIAAGS